LQQIHEKTYGQTVSANAPLSGNTGLSCSRAVLKMRKRSLNGRRCVTQQLLAKVTLQAKFVLTSVIAPPLTISSLALIKRKLFIETKK